ncbi:rho family small GTPase, partial [Naegleria gruberi]
LILGDTVSGKTSLLIALMGGVISDSYVTPLLDPFDSVVNNFTLRGMGEGNGLPKENLHVKYIDTRGSVDYDPIRYLIYPETNLFVICCSLANDEPLKSVITRWLPVIKDKYKMIPFASFLVVGTKSETTSIPKGSFITSANSMFKNVPGYAGAVEVSAMDQTGIKELQQKIIVVGAENLRKKNKDSEGCCTIQ